jgi:hypothetical protein
VLGLEAHAAAFYDALLKVNEEYPNRISPRSLMYWKRAALRPLYLAPNEDDDTVTGPRFLIDYEAQKAKETEAKERAAENGAAEKTEEEPPVETEDKESIAENNAAAEKIEEKPPVEAEATKDG